jgi:hypothetical protein
MSLSGISFFVQEISHHPSIPSTISRIMEAEAVTTINTHINQKKEGAWAPE